MIVVPCRDGMCANGGETDGVINNMDNTTDGVINNMDECANGNVFNIYV